MQKAATRKALRLIRNLQIQEFTHEEKKVFIEL